VRQRFLSAFLLALLATLSVAQAKPLVTVHLAAQLPHRLLRAGDIIHYTVEATNAGSSPAVALSLVAPVPKRTALLSAASCGASAINYRSPDGTWATRASAAAVAVRWSTRRPLAPHARLRCEYSVIVK
jgi:uncharacterized repeat protein (TIGR01451 family)